MKRPSFKSDQVSRTVHVQSAAAPLEPGVLEMITARALRARWAGSHDRNSERYFVSRYRAVLAPFVDYKSPIYPLLRRFTTPPTKFGNYAHSRVPLFGGSHYLPRREYLLNSFNITPTPLESIPTLRCLSSAHHPPFYRQALGDHSNFDKGWLVGKLAGASQ